MSAQDAANPDANIEFANPDKVTLDILLKGSWRLQDRIPTIESVVKEISSNPRIQHISFSSSGITAWDSGLLVFLSRLIRSCKDMKLHVNADGLPGGIRKLLDLAASSPEAKAASRHDINENLLSQIGNSTIDIAAGVPDALRFLGESVKSIRRKAQYNSTDLYFIIQQVGPQALPIVSLISFLVGLILAYMGALQLERFGAQIYVADLVGIAPMSRFEGAPMH